jgi:MbtH protein
LTLKGEVVMSSEGLEVEASFKVVVNAEEQYSIWPAQREVPRGWRETGAEGSRAHCLAHIREVWTDMRPSTLRRKTRVQ